MLRLGFNMGELQALAIKYEPSDRFCLESFGSKLTLLQVVSRRELQGASWTSKPRV